MLISNLIFLATLWAASKIGTPPDSTKSAILIGESLKNAFNTYYTVIAGSMVGVTLTYYFFSIVSAESSTLF